jgi:hypothetical protein
MSVSKFCFFFVYEFSFQWSVLFVGVEKSGKNSEGDSWWETWQEVLHQDEWSNLARIERSAQKQAKSGTENAGWYEKW